LIYHSGYSCVYSLTESEIPYVTQVINHNQTDPSLVVVGGMSGIGAKASLAYGLIAADIVLGNENNSLMYQKAKSALGVARLMKDLQNIKESKAEVSSENRTN
jgi:glycine/D-amino acid oxidase-like deaminating enzyme